MMEGAGLDETGLWNLQTWLGGLEGVVGDDGLHLPTVKGAQEVSVPEDL